MRTIERALLSVHDKTGIVDFARSLASMKVEIISTGGTSRLLASSGIPVRDVSDLTGFPEMLDGRVKTLHPRVAAGMLAIRQNAEHARQISEHSIPLIDLVCVNLYPFVETIRKADVTLEEAIENIDIGGPTMIRAAAKNYQDVAVVTSPGDYAGIVAGLQAGKGVLDRAALFRLAQKAFVMTARYDAAIAEYLSGSGGSPSSYPANVFMDFEKISDLRYGENPHQTAAFYRWGGQKTHGLAAAKQLQGKELSYNNIVDLEAAWKLVQGFERSGVAIIKHTNPCGAAVAATLKQAYIKAYEADAVSAFGSIIGCNRIVDAETAEEIAKLFVEAIAAPDFDPDARKVLSAKKNLRLLAMQSAEPGLGWARYDAKRVGGGLLLQSADDGPLRADGESARVVTKRGPTPQERLDLDFAWRVARHARSNAIVLAQNEATVGVGAGQMSRVDSVKISIQKAREASRGSVLASDGFFPFRDGLDAAAAAGVTAVIQPGGSVNDSEVVQAADEAGMCMILTGERHFSH